MKVDYTIFDLDVNFNEIDQQVNLQISKSIEFELNVDSVEMVDMKIKISRMKLDYKNEHLCELEQVEIEIRREYSDAIDWCDEI